MSGKTAGRPSSPWDIALIGFTGITVFITNTVPVVDTYRNSSTQKDNGGLYLGLLAGQEDFHAFPTAPDSAVLVTLSAGGSHTWQRESGIDAKDYFPRWTLGWGGYGSLRVDFLSTAHGGFWGIQVRYLYTRSLVNDFYYDPHFGASSYDQIPPTCTDDQRVMVVFEIGGLLDSGARSRRRLLEGSI